MAKRALLIGVNRYHIPGADLRGCVNDVKNMQTALIKYFGFAAKDIKVLTDLRATKVNMEAGIRNLIASAKSGDVLYLHYSGHGANVPDADGDEADQRDEILCPTDLDWKDPLTDDWLRKEFDRLPKKVNLTVVMDCCHSGSNTRAIAMPDQPIINRYLPNPWDMMAEESGRALTGRTIVARKVKKGKTRGTMDIAVANMPEVLVTGCRDYQTSADAYIGNSYNGALTYYLVQAITAKKGQASYRDLHSRTIALLRKGRYDQVPQLEGRNANFDRAFLAPFA